MILWVINIFVLNHPEVYSSAFNSSPPGQNGRHFADDMFNHIFVNENIWMSNKILLKHVPWCLFNNMPACIGSDNGLAPSRRQTIIWTNADPVHRRIFAALGRDELTVNESWPIVTEWRHMATAACCVKTLYFSLRKNSLNFKMLWFFWT